MACTTILVGKKASYDGSTMIARNDDSGSGHFTPKKFVVIHPEEQPKTYKSVISHVTIELPDDPLRYTAVPNAVEGEGIWADYFADFFNGSNGDAFNLFNAMTGGSFENFSILALSISPYITSSIIIQR